MRLHIDSDLSAAIRELDSMTDAAKRGRLFEGVVADLFRANHFEVRPNAGAARPRQTDLLATKVVEVYLIECKWRSAKANIDAIDSLRARLRRTSGATGLLIGMAGFSGTAISDVAEHRNQPILLLSGDELRRLASRPAELAELLWRKREALRVDGQALVDEPVPVRQRRRKPRALPDSLARFVIGNQEPAPMIEFGGGFGQFTFTHELVDIDWSPSLGSGVTLDVPVPAVSERGVLDLLDKLADLGWVSSDARWSIQQSKTSWHGFGAASFAAELPRWKHRASRPDPHHTEEFCYLDRCSGGFYTLTADMSAAPARWARYTVLSFQLEGIPLDSAPLLQLCRSIGVHDDLFFRPLAAQSTHRVHLPAWMTTVAEPHSHIVTPGDSIDAYDEWVTGVVLPNPLRQPRWYDDPLRQEIDLRRLEEPEFLVAHLGEFHPVGDGKKYAYRLERIERTKTSEASVYRPVAAWDYADD